MNADRLLAHFERIADAPDAIDRLRQFILDLAVRGKLVPHDCNDEPAALLLQRIAHEKRTKKLAPKASTLRVNAEAFAIPDSWVWASIESLADVEMGQSPPSEHYNKHREGIPFYQGKADFGERNPTPRYWCTRPSKFAETGDVLLSVRAPVGPTNVADQRCCIGRGLAAIRPYAALDRDFLLLCLRAFEFVLASLGFGTTFAAINKSQLTSFALPVPPLAEQQRIVAKVHELMVLCNRLEAARAEREAKRERLTRACFARLNRPDPDPARFVGDARFAIGILPTLTARREQIQQLRQTILNLAVLGRLEHGHRGNSALGTDPQNSDGIALSASFPAHWRLVTLSEAASAIVDCPHSTPTWTTSGKICVRTNQFRPGHLDLTNSRFVSKETYIERVERIRPEVDDILYSREGGVLGIACRIPPNVELCLGQRMMLIRAGEDVSPAFLELLLNSPLITSIAKTQTTGGAAPRVNVATIKAYPLPLPPLDEQAQVVAKVDELMALCDRLEASLSNTETTRGRLLETLLADALAPVAGGLQVTH